uniref:Apidaecin A n=1 Tax=Sphecius speciosus TaxID=7487 RepID=APDA_SPHSE|nr:RecName: Full=Apidaecin A [Sphecius speciosus]
NRPTYVPAPPRPPHPRL